MTRGLTFFLVLSSFILLSRGSVSELSSSTSHERSVIRKCTDPWLYLVYIRIVPGVCGSSRSTSPGGVDFGVDRCSGEYIIKTRGIAAIPSRPSGYLSQLLANVVVAIGEDDGGTIQVNATVAVLLGTLTSLLAGFESQNITPAVARSVLGDPAAITNRQQKKSGGRTSRLSCVEL